MSEPAAGNPLRRWANSTFFALRNRHYRILWIGTTLAFLAFMMSWVVQSVVAFELTGRNGAVGAVSMGMGVATICIAPFGGVIADRVSKRRLLLLGQTAVGVNFALVGLLIVFDRISIAWLVASTFVMGSVFSFIGPARQAWVGELLSGREMANGIALQQVAMTATRILGPLLAAVLIGLPGVGTGGTYLFMAALFVVVVGTLAQLPATRPRGGAPVSVLEDLKAGVSHLRARPRLELLALLFIGIVIGGYSYQVVLPGLLENELNRSARDLGLLMGVGAVAGFIATIGLAGLAGSRHAWPLMFAGAALLGGSLLWAALAESFLVLAAAMFLAGAGTGAFQMLNNALVMQESEPAYYGRVMSLTMLAWGANGLAGLPFGLLADAVGERATVFVMGSIVLGSVGIAAAVFAAIQGRTPEPRVSEESEAAALGRRYP